MIEDYNTFPIGSVIIAVVYDEGSKRLSADAKEIFTSMGAK
jgi:hypothetical protein